MANFGLTKEVVESTEGTIFINKTGCNHSISNCVQRSSSNLAYLIPYCMITVIANGLVCYAIRKRGLLRLSIYSFIFNMCISDMMSLIAITCNTFILSIVTVPYLLLYQISCKFFNYLLSVSMTVSMLTYTMMAIDRYFITVVRKKHRFIFQGKRGIRLIISCIWFHSLITSIPVLHIMSVYNGVVISPKCDISYLGDHYNLPYFAIYFAFNYFIPMIIAAVLHILIVIRLKTAVSIGVSYGRAIPPVLNVNKKKTINVIKMVATTTTIYIITTLPYVLIILTLVLERKSLVEMRQIRSINSLLITAGFLLSALACIENPIVCFIMSKMLRKPLKDIYHYSLCRKTAHYQIRVQQK